MSDIDEDRALDALALAWGDAYQIYVVGGQWQAWREDARDEDVLTGSTPDETTASWGYYRLRNIDYGDAQLAAWAAALVRPGRRDAFCYFKHEDAGTGPALAARLRARLDRALTIS